MDQINLLENMKKLNDKSRPKKGKDKKQNTFDHVSALYEGLELTLNAFKSGIFPIKEKQEKQGKESKLLTPKQMNQRLQIAATQVKGSENLLNKIGQIIHSLYRRKEDTKKVYNIIMNSIKL